MCSREQETSCKCFILGGCHFANTGWMVYILTVLSGSVYPAGYSLSAHWMHSPLFIHSFPRGQVLSLWWIGAGAGQLFSLDGTSLTCSELKRPPCQSSFATSVLFRSPHKGCHRLHTYADTSPHYLTSLGCFLFEFSWGIWGAHFNFISCIHTALCHVEIMDPAGPASPVRMSSCWSGEVFWEHLLINPHPHPLNWIPVHYDKSVWTSLPEL